jgi:prepilin-type N-terminal cleavage/methylation domain-containing protein
MKKGFTLIELMVVIAIIALLSAITLAVITNARTKARDTVRRSDLSQIALAIHFYFNEHQQLPRNSSGWCTYISNTDSDYGPDFQQDISDNMPDVPLDPLYHNDVGDYLYINENNDQGVFTLCANLENDTGNSYDHTGCTGGTTYNYCISQ